MALTDKLTAIGDAIRSKTGGSDLLTLDEMPQEIQSIQTGGGGDTALADSIVDGSITTYSSDNVLAVPSRPFYDNANLVSVALPNCKTIGGYTFSGCSSLESLSLDSLETITGSYVLRGATSLKELSLPSIKALSSSTFYNSGLIKCDLGSELESIPSSCFTSSTYFRTLILRSSYVVSLSSASAINSGTMFFGSDAGIYVPRDLVESYKVATNWTTFASKIKAIEDYPEICGDAAADANEEVS